MDDDEFDGDLADEDLMLAYEATSSASHPAPKETSLSTSFSNRNSAPTAGGPEPARNGPGSFSRPPSSFEKNGNARLPLQPGRSHGILPAQPTDDLDGLPSDAFDSSLPSGSHTQRSIIESCRQPLRMSGQQSFRQTTLYGGTLQEEPAQPTSSSRVYRGDQPPEQPTHHKLDVEAMKTWVYPTNLGPIRDYQFSIVKNALFHNTLVALPTGLGKTFIAATVILNFYRWTKDAKMVFVAPTKPLVSQQVDACFNIAGIPRSETTLLTGDTSPALRAEAWASKRLFFMTPQTLQNDLSKGYADPKSIVLLVIDEAHRATGDYAYVKVIGFIRRFTKSFRVLALTATPGSTVEGVQQVIDNLGVSHVEIRTEESIDIRKYVHNRDIERYTLDPSLEIRYAQERLSKALQPFCDKLSQQKIWYGRDPMSLTTYGLLKARNEWVAGPARHLNQGTKYMIMAVFAVLMSLSHAVKMLTYHGIKPFYDSMAELRKTTEKDEKGSKYKRQLINDPDFQEMMMTIERWLQEDSFESHPKISFLKETINNHFQEQPPGSNSRAIVFSEYRDSAEEIVRTMNRCGPNIKASIFVGQADSKRSSGMKQKQQIETIEQFKSGAFNVLVATSIGEEGLDIGQVDLIICYDASSSPIRMLQRMGRTGRKRAGHVILLLMKGKEEEKFASAQDNYAQMQQMICDGSQFNFRTDLSERIIPRNVKPEVEKRFVEIPVENTQDTSLPEPRRGGARAKKAPKKKFHMPDNAETGFIKASSALGGQTKLGFKKKDDRPVETDFLAEIPDLQSLIAKSQAQNSFNKSASFSSGSPDTIVVDPAQSEFLQTLRPTKQLGHGAYTRRTVELIRRIADGEYVRPTDQGKNYRRIPVPAFATDSGAEDEEDRSDAPARTSEPLVKRQRVSGPPLKRAPKQQTQRQRMAVPMMYDAKLEDDEDNEDDMEARRRKKKSFAPTIKGMTKQRSSQWQSYDFSGGQGSSSVTSTTARRQRHVFSDHDEEQEAEEEETEDEVEDVPLPPMTGRGRGRGRGRGSRGARGARADRGGRGSRGGGRGRGRGGRGGTVYSSYGRLEDRGDDCTRTSDNYETDGSDSGGDLLDFVVEDGEEDGAMSSTRDDRGGDDDDGDEEDDFESGLGGRRAGRTGIFTSSPTTCSSPPRGVNISDKAKKPTQENGQFYVPIRLSQTLDSDDVDEFSMSVFDSKRGKPASTGSDGGGDDTDVLARRPSQAQKRRRIVDDSESDY